MDQALVYFVLSLPLVGAFAMFALGLVVIFQASRVLNLAHGVMAMIPAYLAYEASQRGAPAAACLLVGVGSGAMLGALIERLFVKGLRRQGPTGQTVGTVAALALLLALAVKTWGTTPRNGVALFPEGGVSVGASVLSYGQIGLISVAVGATVAFFALFQWTNLGLAMRVAADNRRAASLMGIDPDFTSRVAWMLGGGLAALAGVLLAAVTTLHPVNLSLLVLPAFVAALIGGLESPRGALAGAAVVGLAQGMVPALSLLPGLGGFAGQLGAPQLVLTAVAFVVMIVRGSRFVGSDIRGEVEAAAAGEESSGSREETELEDVRTGSAVTRHLLRVVVAVALVGWVFLDVPFSWLGSAINACIILLVAISVVLLTGWVGQISLAQASFVGLGAFGTALLSRTVGVAFPLSLPFAAAFGASAAAALGVVALRVRGLYLAVASLIFLWMTSEYLFSQAWLAGVGGSVSLKPQRIGDPDAIPHFDFTDRRTFYFVVLAIAAAALWGLANLRDSKAGRALFAVRGSEIAAASLGIDVTRYKLLAFAISGFLAGAAGNLLIVNQGAAVPAQFAFNVSLFYLAVPVVGGLTSLGGAIAASILFAALDELFFRVSALAGWLEVVSAGLLTVALLVRPGGLASLPAVARPAVRRIRLVAAPVMLRVRRVYAPLVEFLGRGATGAARVVVGGLGRLRRRGIDEVDGVDEVDGANGVQIGAFEQRQPESRPLALARVRGTPIVEAADITVRFGGLVAVGDVSLKVCEGEIVGLIGPNGAGKTTMFNAISGLNVPTSGTVSLFGSDVTHLPVHKRAAVGMARTFQVVQLFPQLSVYENLLVATHLQNRSGVFANVVVSRPSLIAEDEARTKVDEVVDLLDLRGLAQRQVAGLPFGVLRMVEVARAMVTGARFVMLDEPASGLDNAETEHLAEVLRFIRAEQGVNLLLIEHDVAMVTGVSDYLYVLNRGHLIAEGVPDEIQRNEEVIAAYLGRPASADAPGAALPEAVPV